MKDNANGYSKIDLNVFSNRIFLSNKAAKVKPITSVKINEKIPYIARFSIDIIHLRVSHKRSYWSNPTNFHFGNNLEDVKEYTIVQIEPPRKTIKTVNIIGIDAIFAFIFLKS